MSVTDILFNYIFIAAGVSWLVAQIVKVIYYSVKAHGFRIEFLTSSGGFPSSHTATVTALTVMSAKVYGLDSPVFAVAFFLAMIVIYDAQGVRAEVGRISSTLNVMKTEHPELFPDDDAQPLNENTGHTMKEIIAGLIIGFAVALLMPIW